MPQRPTSKSQLRRLTAQGAREPLITSIVHKDFCGIGDIGLCSCSATRESVPASEASAPHYMEAMSLLRQARVKINHALALLGELGEPGEPEA